MHTFALISFALFGLQLKVIVLSDTTYGMTCHSFPCDEYCPYGYIFGENQCRTCTCINPCANISCPLGQECKVEQLICIQPTCGFVGVCGPECPLLNCVSSCPYGFEYDENQCRTCTCKDHCKNEICRPGETCIIEHLCNFGLCGIKPKCTKQCQDLPCHTAAHNCQYGFELDYDNCPTCVCKNPCAGVICPRHQYCLVNRIFCVTTPCPPPSPSCHSYCPGNSLPLLGFSDIPVQCPAGDWECPKGYNCVNVRNLNESYCCSAPVV